MFATFLGCVAAALSSDPVQTEALRAADAAFPEPGRVLFDREADGTQWALGATYKASLGTDGFVYVPFLGSDAPRNRPVRLRLASVTVDGVPLDVDPGQRAARDGTDLVLDRGGFVERYSCRLDEVEQTIVVDRIQRAGEVRASYVVDTDLERIVAADGCSTFACADGHVRIGTAIAIAPDGRTVHAATVPTARGYDLVVPSAFVESFDGPLIIDPVISTGTVTQNPLRDDVSVDVATFDGGSFSGGDFVAVERAFSATDSDIYIYRVSSPNSVQGSFIATIDFTSTNWSEPSIAGRDSADDLMTVAVRGLGADRRIYARRVASLGAVVELPFALSNSIESYEPDVGVETGGPFLQRRWLAAWTSVTSPLNTDIVIRPFTESGPADFPYRFTTSQLPDRSPSVCEAAGGTGFSDPQRFRVAWKRIGSFTSEVFLQEFDRDADAASPRSQVGVGRQIGTVSVSSESATTLPDGRHPYVVVWDSRDFVGSDRDVHAVVCADGAAVGAPVNVSEMVDLVDERLQLNPDVATDGAQWSVVYEQRTTSLSNGSIVLCSGDLAGTRLGLGERYQVFSPTTGDQVAPKVVSRYEGGTALGETQSFAAWTNRSTPSRTEGGFFEAVGVDVAGVQYCDAAPNSSGRPAWIAAYGDSSTTSPKTLRVTDAPPLAPCYILTARDTNYVIGVGGGAGNLCLGGTGFGRFSLALGPIDAGGRYELVVDPTAIAQPNGTVAAQPGQTWYFQAWFRDSDSGQATSNLSNAVAIEFEL
ncbi:MAG: hypothetical protein AAF726_05120 [Planctomycetota bacterium]